MAESAEKQQTPEAETTLKLVVSREQSATTAPADNKESEKPGLPCEQQERTDYITTNQLLFYDGWEKNKPCQSEMEKWGQEVFGLIGEERDLIQ